MFGLWYLQYGFLMKQTLAKHDLKGLDQAWAGSLFQWFTAFVVLLTARFAVATNDGKAV